MVDPRGHTDGQKSAIQIDKEIGGSPALMDALVKEINTQNPFAAYQIEANPIFDASTFWVFAEENHGRVTSLTFDLIAPNGLWNTASSIKEELAELRQAIKTQQVVTTFRSSEGLDTDNDRIKEAVDYAEKGSGKIRAKAKGNKHFNSTEKPKITTLEDERGARGAIMAKVKANLSRIFGRE